VAKKKADPPKPVARVVSRPKKKTATDDATSAQVHLHLPNGMRDKLAEAAVANLRSLGDEIIHRLAQSIERDEAQKLSARLEAEGDHIAKFEGDIAAIVAQLKRQDD